LDFRRFDKFAYNFYAAAIRVAAAKYVSASAGLVSGAAGRTVT
jgi:hypothetical protein